MERIIIFGAGKFCERYIERNSTKVNILAIVDNFPKVAFRFGYKIISPSEIEGYDYDKVVICLNDFDNLSSVTATDRIISQLLQLGIPDSRIKLHNVFYDKNDRRVNFLQEYSHSVEKCKLKGAVAECGVYRGHFAHYINKYLKNHTFYLFDTFQGFDENDIKEELNFNNILTEKHIEEHAQSLLVNGRECISLRRCEEVQNIIVKKGYIPNTFEGLEDEQFVFVSLDLDLYKPTLDALKWFAKRMVKGGVILCHDYLHPAYNIEQAIEEFEKDYNFVRLYIGEGSMAMMILED